MSENNEIIFDQADVDGNKWVPIVMLLIPILFFLPLVMEDKKNSPYCKFYSNQVLLYLIFTAVLSFVSVIPILGWIIGGIGGIMMFIFWIIVLVGAIQGKAKKFPIFGGISIIK